MEYRKDLFLDDNGLWVMIGCKVKFYIIIRDNGGKVVELEKVDVYVSIDVVVKRRINMYMCFFYMLYYKIIVFIEFVKDIEKWFLVVFFNYNFDGEFRRFKVKNYGN